jgi:histidyl-tRNA synthetase
MPDIQAVKGTRDFYPEEMAFRTWLYDRIRQVSTSFGYQEYDAPFLEHLELYAAKSGEELVKEQSFVFPDRGGDMLALRPELTPSLARMVAARVKTLPAPIRWWSFGPCWRYEKPQKGRTREFFQWNIDLIGLDAPAIDAELAGIAATFFDVLGLSPDDVQIMVNSRRLVDQQLAELGVPKERRSELYHLIDRRDRMSSTAWDAYAKDGGVDDTLLSGIHGMLADEDAWKKSDDLTSFFEASKALGTDGYLRFDPSIIRGLDYYTGIVFEARDVKGEQRAILGGGRYDNLVADVGGDSVPATGFAMGDVVIELVLEAAGAMPSLNPAPAQVLVTNFDPSLEDKSLSLANELRRAGFRAEWYPESARMGKQLRYADRYGIPLVAILGPEEDAAGTITLKDMLTGDQTTISRQTLKNEIQHRLP